MQSREKQEMQKRQNEEADVQAAAAQERDKRPVGRPSLYDPKYCDMVVADMKDGYSLSAFAATIDVSRSTLNEWMSVHPDFSDAVSRGKTHRLRKWEEIGMKVAQGGGTGGQSQMVAMGLKNAGSEEWREKQEIAHSGTITLGDLVAASYKKDEGE